MSVCYPFGSVYHFIYSGCSVNTGLKNLKNWTSALGSGENVDLLSEEENVR